MDHQLGMGKGLHVAPGAPGMIQMDVGQNHPGHALRAQAQLGQGGLHPGQGFVVSGIDDGHLPPIHHQVNGGQERPGVVSVNGVDAVGVRNEHSVSVGLAARVRQGSSCGEPHGLCSWPWSIIAARQ